MRLELEGTYRKERKSLLNFIKHHINDVQDAEDLLQDIFTKAAESMNILQPIENIAAWMYTAARNRIIDYYRSRNGMRNNSPTLSLSGLQNDEETGLEDLLRASGLSLDDELLRKEVADALFESLDLLPAAQREVFLLQAVEGRKFREIAELTGESINTLMARKRYAVLFLRNRLIDLKKMIDEPVSETKDF